MDKEYLKDFDKEEIYDIYTSLNIKVKPYDNITKNKMLEIIDVEYQDYHNIISICTLKELNFLKELVAKGKISLDEIEDEFAFEISSLFDKFIIKLDEEITIMDGLEDSIKEALKNLDIKEKENEEDVLIPLIGCLRLLGIERLDNLIFLFAKIYNMENAKLEELIKNSMLFKYYGYIMYEEPYEYLAVYKPYLDSIDELINLYAKKKSMIKVIDDELFINAFYYGYDIRDKEIKDYMDKVKIPILKNTIIVAALFDEDRKPLKKFLQEFNIDITKLDKIMDKMPSSKYQLLSKEEYAKTLLDKKKFEEERDYTYHKQVNASMHPKDCDLFYKLYFALLEYTNNEYKINQSLKIYKNKYLNPQELYPIINKFFENKETIVDRVVKENPYKLNKLELEYLKDFKRGIRDKFIIYKYEKEYTLISNNNTIYMVKGLRCPIDEIVDYRDLPYAMETSLIPFRGYIVYDGIIAGYEMSLSTGMKINLLKEAEEFPRVYKL